MKIFSKRYQPQHARSRKLPPQTWSELEFNSDGVVTTTPVPPSIYGNAPTKMELRLSDSQMAYKNTLHELRAIYEAHATTTEPGRTDYYDPEGALDEIWGVLADEVD